MKRGVQVVVLRRAVERGEHVNPLYMLVKQLGLGRALVTFIPFRERVGFWHSFLKNQVLSVFLNSDRFFSPCQRFLSPSF